MEFKLHKDFSEFDPEEWNDLLAGSITNAPFLRYEYLCGWWETLGGGEWNQAELVLVSARQGVHLIGIAPLFLAEYDGRPALMLIGSIEVSDYLDLIVRSGDLEQFTAGLLDFLLGHPWQALDWYNIPDNSPTLNTLKVESDKRGWTFSQEIYRPTPTILLPGDFDTYLMKLDKKQRHEIRRKRRRLEETGLSVRWYISDGSGLESDIEALFTLMDGDPNKAGFLTPRMRTQLRTTIHAAHKGGWLWLAFLEIGGRKAAAALNFDYNGRLWGYNSGVEPAYLNLSPGWVLLSHSLEWAIDNGRMEFDFMRGDEEYKYRFGAVNRYVLRVKVSPSQVARTSTSVR